MFAELFTAALNAIKLAPRYPAPIGIVAAALVFIPQEYLQVIGVHQLAQDYRPVFGLLTLFWIATLAVSVSVALWRATSREWGRRKFKRSVYQRLTRLSEDEKQILRFYIRQ